jgi:hypothetical protein
VVSKTKKKETTEMKIQRKICVENGRDKREKEHQRFNLIIKKYN